MTPSSPPRAGPTLARTYSNASSLRGGSAGGGSGGATFELGGGGNGLPNEEGEVGSGGSGEYTPRDWQTRLVSPSCLVSTVEAQYK